jgi:hypothetical protein
MLVIRDEAQLHKLLGLEDPTRRVWVRHAHPPSSSSSVWFRIVSESMLHDYMSAYNTAAAFLMVCLNEKQDSPNKVPLECYKLHGSGEFLDPHTRLRLRSPSTMLLHRIPSARLPPKKKATRSLQFT